MSNRDSTQLIRLARGLEAGGFYGLAKLLRAMAFSQEVKATNAAGIPRGAELMEQMRALMGELRQNNNDPTLINAIEKGMDAVLQDRTIPHSDIPEVYVSRTNGDLFLGKPPTITPHHDHWLALREFKPIWYSDPLPPADLLEALEANPQVIRNEISGLSAEQLLIAPAEGEWNMHQLLWHIMMAQELLTERVDLLLTTHYPNLASKAVWAQQDEQGMTTGEIVEHYLDLRADLVERLKGLPADDWWRKGWHDEFGEQTTLSQVTYFTRHEISHLPQFAEIRQAVEG